MVVCAEEKIDVDRFGVSSPSCFVMEDGEINSKKMDIDSRKLECIAIYMCFFF